MTLSQVLKSIIDDETTDFSVECVQTNLVKITVRKKGGPSSDVTFNTTSITPTQVYREQGPIGIVLWIDRDDWDRHARKVEDRHAERAAGGAS